MKIKKIVSLLIAVILCFSLFTVGASAKIATPTNKLVSNGNGGKTDVGIWFMTYNNQNMFGSNFGSGYPIRYRTLMPDGSFGVLDSSKVEHIDFMLKQIADAKIDFILYDLTNGGLTAEVPYGWNGIDEKGKNKNWIVANARLTCERIAEWNKNNDWKIKYALAVGAYDGICNGVPMGMVVEAQAKAIYNEWFMDPVIGGDNYYQIDGKLFLEIHDWGKDVREIWERYAGDRTYGDKFFVRNGMAGEKGTYGWYCAYGTSIVDEEVMLVNPGQRNAGSSTPHAARENGKLYKTCWESVLNNTLPRIVMISSFNDYNEQTAVFTADSSKCKGDVDEQWRDATGKLNPSMYWDMTKEGIRLVRTYNGEIDGEFKSNVFNLGGNTSGTTANSNNMVLIIVIAVTAVVIIVGVIVCVLLLGKKKK